MVIPIRRWAQVVAVTTVVPLELEYLNGRFSVACVYSVDGN